MKKILAILLSLMMAFSVPMTCFAAEDHTQKTNTEFGTMYGKIESSIQIGRKQVNYFTQTTKTAARLIVFIEAKLYLTGKTISSDERIDRNNVKEVGYDWECHNDSYNKQKLSAFGTHEARGKTSLVGYTGISNF